LPLISIIVPSYNHSRYLPERLDTILHQSFKDFECIILDDASYDGSIKILREYVSSDLRFKLLQNDTNSGSTFEQWNQGVSLASGKYIWIAESDDFSDLYFLENLVLKLEENNSIVLAYCDSLIIDEYSQVIGNWEHDSSVFNKNFCMDGIKFVTRHLIYKNVIPNASAVVFRRDCYEKVGGAMPTLKSNGDWELWIKLLLQGDIYFNCSTLNYFRRHDLSVTAVLNNDMNIKSSIFERMIDLRLNLKKYLDCFNGVQYEQLQKENNLQLSLCWGDYGLFLKNKGYIFGSFYYILKSSFYPNLKTYFLKKFFFGSFYNYLFSK
jgi:glycosyltransferase involved in cell wall biosynthesis